MFKKLFTAGISVVLSTSIAFAANNNEKEPLQISPDFVSALPYSVTNSIYRYADIMGETETDVDMALITWLNDSAEFSSLPFFAEDPAVFDESILRQSLDYFYVLAYLEQYLLQYCSTAPVPLNGYNLAGPTPFDNLRMCMDSFMPMSGPICDLFTEMEGGNPDVESVYYSVRNIYDEIKNIAEALGIDMEKNVNTPIEIMISAAKANLRHAMADIHGYDVTRNQYVLDKSFVPFWNNLLDRNLTPYSYDLDCELFDEVLFDTTVRAEDLFEATYLDFTEDDLNDVIVEHMLSTEDELNAALEPYLLKAKKNLYLRFLNVKSLIDAYCDNKVPCSYLIHNGGPFFYKMLDMIEASFNNDWVNYLLMTFLCEEDIQFLFSTFALPDPTGIEENGISHNMTSNPEDLRVEKYLAKVRLGKVLEGYEANGHVSIYERYVNDIYDIENPTSEDEYLAGVSAINDLVEKGYKELNVNIVSDYQKLPLVKIENSDSLISSMNDRYSITTRPSQDSTAISAINTQIDNDYSEHLIGLDKSNFDLVIFNEIEKEEVISLDEPLKITVSYADMTSKLNFKVYRYDQTTSEVVALDNGVNEDGYDYFEINDNNLKIVTKNAGSFAFATNDKAVENKLAELEDTIETLTGQIEDLNNTIEAKDETISGLEEQIETLQGQIETLEGEIEGLETENASLESANSSLTGQITTLEGEIETLEGNILTLNGQIASLEQDILELGEQLEAYEAQITVLTNEKSALITQNGALQTQIENLQSQINALQASIAQLTSEKTSLQQSVDSLTTELNSVKEDLAAKKAEIEGLNQKISERNSYSIVFIVLACFFALTTATFFCFYVKEKDDIKAEREARAKKQQSVKKNK